MARYATGFPTLPPTWSSPWSPIAVGIAAGMAADRIWGDPRRFHPVAGFGTMANRVEQLVYKDKCTAGALYVLVCVGFPVSVSAALHYFLRHKPVAIAAFTAVTAWTALGGKSLNRAAVTVAKALEQGHLLQENMQQGNIATAQGLLSMLCARDASALNADEIACAVTESVAENTSDAVVAPLLWGVVLGPTGFVAYRCINTLDAMVGYKTDRYRNFGFAAAKLDDAVNYLPARFTAVVAALCAPLMGGSPRETVRVWSSDAAGHPSPNAGVVESAFAGALNIRLGGTQNNYGPGHNDTRPAMGTGKPPTVRDISRVTRLSTMVSIITATVSVVVAGSFYRSKTRPGTNLKSRARTTLRRITPRMRRTIK